MLKQNRPIDSEQVAGAAMGALSHGRAATRPSELASFQGREDRGFRVDEGPRLPQTAPTQAPNLGFHAALDVSVGNIGPGGGEGGESGKPPPCLGWAPYSLIRALHLRRPGGPPHIKLAVEWDIDTKER